MWSNSAGEGPPFHESVRLWVFSFGQGLKSIAEVFQGPETSRICPRTVPTQQSTFPPPPVLVPLR